MSIAENVARIRAEMEAAAYRCGRDPKTIQLCAATKMNDADAVRQAIAAGVDCCGENRDQELTAKLAQNAYEGAPVHFIGHLQTNKVKQVVGKVDLIQSVDSERLLLAIDTEAAKPDLLASSPMFTSSRISCRMPCLAASLSIARSRRSESTL